MADEEIVFGSVRVRVSEAGIGWTVEIDATLRANDGAAGDILFQLAVSPLTCLALRSSRGLVRETYGTTARERFFRVSLEPALGETWDGTSITMVLLWCPNESSTSGRDPVRLPFETPCLVLPDMLPSLIASRNTMPAPRSDQLCRVMLDGPLPERLEHGWIRAPKHGARQEDSYLQLVIFESMMQEPATEGPTRLTLARSATTSLTAAEAAQAYAYARPLLTYLARELGTPESIRAVVCLSEKTHSRVYGFLGAYSVVAPDRAGARAVNVGSPGHILLELARSWVGGGLRLTGENALELTGAVGGALGLRWLEYMELHTPLDRAIKSQEAAIELARQTGNWGLKERAYAIQQPLYRALESAAIRAKLRSLIADHWGSHLPQEIWVEELRGVGVSVPVVYT